MTLVFYRDIASNDAVLTAIEDTECDLSNTQQLETSVMLNASTIPDRIVIYCHNLTSDQLMSIHVKSASKKLNFCQSQTLTEAVTHVIVNLDPDTNSCNEDLTYHMAILMGKWILDNQWLVHSFDNLVDETPFMASGSRGCLTGAPTSARSNFSSRRPRLFDGCHIYLLGTFSRPYPSKAEMLSLLKAGGAVILSREPNPEAVLEEQRLPYHVRSDSLLDKCSHFIIYQEGSEKEPLLKYNMPHIKSLPAAWLFMCINNFFLVDPFK
jgi:BRCA1-associated RING domain protein 1